MARSPYLDGPGHAATLESACADFHRALTRRWRREVCTAALAGTQDFPTAVRREISPHAYRPLWEFWSVPAQQHLRSRTGCAYVQWVQAGQDGDLAAVRCSGATDVSDGEQVTLPDPVAGEMWVVPGRIECGMGDLLGQVADWAWAEREVVFGKLPLFDHHDVREIDRAHHTFLEIGASLALEAPGSDALPSVPAFTSIDDRAISVWVADVAARSSDGQDWWAGWTGLAAQAVKEGFFASAVPTLNNQSAILGHLANLYSDRAAIVVKGRNDALQSLQRATRALGQEEMVTTDLTDEWKVVQGIGTTVTISGAWSGYGAAVGAGITLAGFLGENLHSEIASAQDAHSIEDVVHGLHDDLDRLAHELEAAELDYLQGVHDLRGAMVRLHSFDLELYDLTRNDPDGRRGPHDTGYWVEVDKVLRLAERCYRLGGEYEPLAPRLATTADADRHLAGADGAPTEADRMLLKIRELLLDFLKTTCARYYTAADQVRRAAEAYVEVDTEQRAAFERVMHSWQPEDVSEYSPKLVSPRSLEETDRSGYDPYEGHPAREGGYEPGQDAGGEYVIEE